MKDKQQINGYSMSRAWFDFAFDNPHAKTIHTALYMWFIELSNRLDHPERLTTTPYNTMSVIGINSYNIYKKTFNDLADWGFLKVIQEPKNQYTYSVISLTKRF